MSTTKPKDPKEASKNADGEEAPKKSKKMLFIIIGALVLLLGGGAGYYFLVMKKDKPAGEEVKKVEEAKEPVYVPLDPFTVNLKGGGQYLQTAITLQMDDDKQSERLKTYMPSVRSRVLLLLSNKTADEIADDEGKKVLKTQIIETIKEPFTESAKPIGITDALFTAFVIQ
jgi:flagellar protein FliL